MKAFTNLHQCFSCILYRVICFTKSDPNKLVWYGVSSILILLAIFWKEWTSRNAQYALFLRHQLTKCPILPRYRPQSSSIVRHQSIFRYQVSNFLPYSCKNEESSPGCFIVIRYTKSYILQKCTKQISFLCTYNPINHVPIDPPCPF